MRLLSNKTGGGAVSVFAGRGGAEESGAEESGAEESSGAVIFKCLEKNRLQMKA
jgi:hypothetical protein